MTRAPQTSIEPIRALGPDPAIRPPAVDVLGVPLALIDYAGVLSWIDAMIEERSRGYVCVAATHTVMAAQEDEALRAAVLSSSMTVPDGQPLVWAMKALGASLDARVYGPTLMSLALEHGIANGTRHYLYGGRNQGALVQLVGNLHRRHPGVAIAGGQVPLYRDLTADEEDELVESITRSRADVVWVGLGVPKQEKWMARFRERLDVPVLVGVGAAFDFHAGIVPQAPEWMQRSGLEWAFRLAREPRRLWRRYLRYNPRFVTGFARQYARQRIAKS